MAEGDGIQQTGKGSIAANLDPSVAEIHLVKAYHADKKTWNTVAHVRKVHSAQFFNRHKNNIDGATFEYYCNKNISEANVIHQKLMNKNVLLQNQIIASVKKSIHYLAAGELEGEMSINDPWIIFNKLTVQPNLIQAEQNPQVEVEEKQEPLSSTSLLVKRLAGKEAEAKAPTLTQAPVMAPAAMVRAQPTPRIQALVARFETKPSSNRM